MSGQLVLRGVGALAFAAPAAFAQVPESPTAAECEGYYGFELRVIDEQCYYLNQAAIKAIDAEHLSPEEKAQRTAAARAETDKRFEVDLSAAARSLELCLRKAK
jgi:hypothetical protein